MPKLRKLSLIGTFVLGQAASMFALVEMGRLFYPFSSLAEVPLEDRIAGLAMLASIWVASTVVSAWLCYMAYAYFPMRCQRRQSKADDPRQGA